MGLSSTGTSVRVWKKESSPRPVRIWLYTDFWSVSNNRQIEFDAYIIPANELEDRRVRVLDVDNRTVIPFNVHIRILISSADVLHAWTVPSLGVKADAVPGRLNQVKFV